MTVNKQQLALWSRHVASSDLQHKRLVERVRMIVIGLQLAQHHHDYATVHGWLCSNDCIGKSGSHSLQYLAVGGRDDVLDRLKR